MPALLALVVVTAVWGVTFVQVKDAVAIYPLFAFLAVRFAIATLTLAPVAARRLRGVGWGAGTLLGLLLALGYALQTAGLERTTVSSAGFITGLYVVFTPIFAFALFRIRAGRALWAGVGLAVAGLALLSGVGVGDPVGDLLVLLGSAAYSLQIALMERYARRYDPVAFTFVEMLAAFAGFALVAVALGQVEVPRGWTVWSALLVTGVFASALGFLVQTWAQRQLSAARTALLFALEPVWTAIFGFWLAGDRLGAAGWTGAALIMTGIVVAEPTANYPYVGHKGLAWYEVETHGVTAHGSMPEVGDNAIVKMAKAIGARRLAVSQQDGLAALDTDQKTVTLLARDGRVTGRVAERGAAYQLRQPVDVALDALGPTFNAIAAETGLSVELMHRVAVIGAGTLDSLPHNGAVITLLAVCGCTHRESYRDIAVAAIVGPIVALVAVIVLGSMFGAF